MFPKPNPAPLIPGPRGNGTFNLPPEFGLEGHSLPDYVFKSPSPVVPLEGKSFDRPAPRLELPPPSEQEQSSTTLDSSSTMDEAEVAMPTSSEFSTILERLNEISSENRTELHHLESRMDSKITDLKVSFSEFRRDTREDIKEMKGIIRDLDSTVAGVKDWNRNLVIAVILGALGIALAVWGTSWSILGTLKSFVPVVK